ncbi:MAG: hypothetical protein LBK97_03320 [Prevotellaceae bacterium]|jgi:hypothetical protein|nr:hypothetical protein [Prevotellaceae bacterium]
MNRNLFYLLLLLFPATIFSQEHIQVNTQYDEAEKPKELTVEIVNKSDVNVMIRNIIAIGESISYFELYLYDKDGQQIPAFYPPPAYGVLFYNGIKIPRRIEIKAHTSSMFKYSVGDLFRNYCKESPDKIKKMQLKFYIKYAVLKDGEYVGQKEAYEQFSEMITL